ncbi:hypothetical protein PS838_03846 [Pseudomonas fluorescens]|nr:hypothetical protein PS838_03846 [Pseudomonas fluorescens]
MPPQSMNRASLEQLHRDVAALAEEMSKPAPTAARAFLLPFCIGVAFALTTFVVVALVARLV